MVWYNVLGEEVYLKNLPSEINKLELNASSWKNGIYFCKIISEKDKLVFSKKLIILK